MKKALFLVVGISSLAGGAIAGEKLPTMKCPHDGVILLSSHQGTPGTPSAPYTLQPFDTKSIIAFQPDQDGPTIQYYKDLGDGLHVSAHTWFVEPTPSPDQALKDMVAQFNKICQ